MTSSTKPSVPALAKGFDILFFVGARGEATFTEIQTNLDLPKSSTHNLLGTLEHLGLLRARGNAYSLGLRVFELGGLAVQHLDMRKEARPILRALAVKVQLTCHLGILDGHEGIYLLKEEVEQVLKITSWEGKRIRLLSSGIGKALVAWQPQRLQDAIVQNYPYQAITEHTITDPQRMREHLQQVRERGWVEDFEEDGEGVRCAAAPVLDRSGHALMAISVSGTVQQVPPERLPQLGAEVMAACRMLEKVMGYKGSFTAHKFVV